jgi:transketolase
MRDAFINALTALAEADPLITLITGDLGFGVLTNFAKRFPKQFINAGVAEQNMTAIACGMALEGFKAYTYSIGNFPTLRCLEQIRNDVCYHDASVTVVSVGAGFSYGQLGMSHFALEDLAIMRALPNMQVIVPSDPWEADVLTRQMATEPGPKYLRIDKGSAGITPEPEQLKIGEVRQIRAGSDVTIITIGAIAFEAIKAADNLQTLGIYARVLVVNRLKPLQGALIIQAARETGGIITLEEHSVVGGLGSAVADLCLENGTPPKRFIKMGMQDMYPTVVGDQNYLRKEYGLDSDAVIATALRITGKG